MGSLIIPTKTLSDLFNLSDFQNDINELASRIETYTPADVLAKILTVDTDNAGINASTLQGHGSSDFILASSEPASLGSSGYKKFKDGFIIQWGPIVFTSSAAITWTYPVAFPNRALYAACNVYWGSNPNYTSLNTAIDAAASKSSIQFISSFGAGAVVGFCFAIGY